MSNDVPGELVSVGEEEESTESNDNDKTQVAENSNKQIIPSSYRVSKGKLRVIKCRICEKQMKYQNYETHLKYKHPGENCKDLRARSENSIKNMFTAKRCIDPNKEVEPERKKARENESNTDYNSNITDPQGTTVTDYSSLTEKNACFPLATSVSGSKSTCEKEEIDEVSGVIQLLEKLAPLSKLDEVSVSRFVANIEGLSRLQLAPEVTTTKSNTLNLDNDSLLLSCKSLDEITNVFQEYEYDEQLEAIFCSICSVKDSNNKVLFKYKNYETYNRSARLLFSNKCLSSNKKQV